MFHLHVLIIFLFGIWKLKSSIRQNAERIAVSAQLILVCCSPALDFSNSETPLDWKEAVLGYAQQRWTRSLKFFSFIMAFTEAKVKCAVAVQTKDSLQSHRWVLTTFLVLLISLLIWNTATVFELVLAFSSMGGDTFMIPLLWHYESDKLLYLLFHRK